jgi:hypothetical protein
VRRNGERGSAVIEFALLLPILLLMLLAVVQVGVLASDQLVITQAARAGAREMLGRSMRLRCGRGEVGRTTDQPRCPSAQLFVDVLSQPDYGALGVLQPGQEHAEPLVIIQAL